jgi:hypothetical protein
LRIHARERQIRSTRLILIAGVRKESLAMALVSI